MPLISSTVANVCAVQSLLPTSYSHSADQMFGSFTCRLCDPDLPIKLHCTFRQCGHLQPWLPGNTDIETVGLFVTTAN